MYPILFTFFGFDIYTYGLFMALGVLAGLWVVDDQARLYGWNRDLTTRLVVATFFMGLLGSRILYILTRLGDPSISIWELILQVRSGFVFYGGLAASWLYLVYFLNRYKKQLPFWGVLDAFAMAICIGLALGRIGCLMGGCCFGHPTSLPWGIMLSHERHLGPLHPAPLYEFILLIPLFFLLQTKSRHKDYPGQMVVWFTGIYAIGRFILEYWRGDLIRGYIIDGYLSTSQGISLIFLPIAVAIQRYLRSRSMVSSDNKSSSAE